MRVLIIGSLGGHIGAAAKIALSQGAKVSNVDGIEKGLTMVRAGAGAELVMIDVALDVAAFIEGLRRERMTLPVVACGIGNDASAAVAAIKAGAQEYIPLPPDPALIAAVLQAVTEESHVLVLNDPAMRGVLTLADQVAGSDASILIAGESGTGKEVLSRHIHRKSRRADERFVSVNCAAIPENLLESELFGHERGAFTGAVARRIGKFEEANGGTLLLDEIGDLDPRLQAKLLRAIQEREIDRVGGTQPVKVDIRLIATTNRDLEDEVRRGAFREDLFYRLAVVAIDVPPLRDRPGDIETLAAHFIRKYSEANGLAERPLAAAAMAKLREYRWPGNVRELENAMHRAVLFATGTEVGPDAIVLTSKLGALQAAGAGTPAPDAPAPLAGRTVVGRTVADVERDLIIDTLQHCLGNRTHAANILGISIRTLRNKLKLYGEQGMRVPLRGLERIAV